jgi:hypothetical protein
LAFCDLFFTYPVFFIHLNLNQKHSEMKKKFLLMFLISTSLIGCNQEDPLSKNRDDVTDKNTQKNNFNTDDILNYFKKNLESEHLEPINSIYYDTSIRSDSLKYKKDKAWQLWKDANIGRMASFPHASENETEFIWNLPQAQRMKINTFTKGSKPSTGYPFLINLHGGGAFTGISGPWASSFNTDEWKAALSLGKAYEDSPSYYFIPRMADDRIGRWYYQPQQEAWLRAWQLAVLSNQVDPDRTYILGISEGGYGSFRMGTFYADYFAGIGPMACNLPQKPEHLKI